MIVSNWCCLFTGIPEAAGLRPIYWKILLGYLPPDRSKWDKVLKKNRDQYWELRQELFKLPSFAGMVLSSFLFPPSFTMVTYFTSSKKTPQVLQQSENNSGSQQNF